MDYTFLLLALIVLLSYTIHALSGFGSMIIAVTLGMHLYPIETLLPVLVPLDVLLNMYIVIRHHKQVERGLLVRRILPLMGVGLLTGILLFNYLHNNILKISYGCFVALVSVRELYLLYKKEQCAARCPGWKKPRGSWPAGSSRAFSSREARQSCTWPEESFPRRPTFEAPLRPSGSC